MDDSRKSRRPSEWRTHSLDSILDKLITANHILHYHGIIDAYGHLSVRNPTNPTSFLISKDLAPALVSRREDIEAYHISDASPLSSDAPKGYAERFIHSEIYKQYADVDVIIHSHNEAVLPFSITSVPVRQAQFPWISTRSLTLTSYVQYTIWLERWVSPEVPGLSLDDQSF